MLAASIVASTVGTLLPPSGLTKLLFSVICFIILLAVLFVVFFLTGFVVGVRRAFFRDAFAISVLGTLVLIVCLSVFNLEVAIILSLIVVLLLVRDYCETGLLGFIAVKINVGVSCSAYTCFLKHPSRTFKHAFQVFSRFLNLLVMSKP